MRISIAMLFIWGFALIFSAFTYSKKTLEYVKSDSFQNDARKGSQLIGATIGSTASGLSDGIATTLDDEAVRNLAAKSAKILGKVTKTIASNLDSTLRDKNIFLDGTLSDSGIEPGRAEEKYNPKNNDLNIFIDYQKDFNGKLKLTNYDQNGKKIDAVEKEIHAKKGDGQVEVFTFAHSDFGLTTYYILSRD